MSEQEFRRLSGLVYASSGIHLTEQKRELLRARLRKRMRALNLGSYREYLKLVTSQGADGELRDLLSAVSTNKTEFFRESAHFEHLCRQALPQWRSRGLGEPLRVWSAACSSGEEPYTLAMVLQDSMQGGDFKILGTDISETVLEKALRATYDERRLEGIPMELRRRHLRPSSEAGPRGEELWEPAPELRARVSLCRFNLVEGDFPFRNPMDVIFCRNVMIYFDRPTQEKLVERMSAVLRPGGWLYTGLSESLLAIRHGLKTLGPSVYQKPA
jgi:chemotaxis protein methyltransferase CheR